MKQTIGQSTTETRLRYNIKSRLAELTAAEALTIKQDVRKATKTTRSSMSRFLNEKKTDKHYMPMNVLQAFAQKLQVTMEQLLNK